MKDYLAKVAEAMTRVDLGELENAVRILKEVKENRNMVWLVGNGGSAATVEHFANDLVKMAGVRAIALPSLFASVSAYGNDDGWDLMFADFLMDASHHGDALVAVSCSGNSPNVVEAAKLFHHDRLIVLTGNKYESQIAGMDADCKLFVMDGDVRAQEDVHLALCHAIVGGLG